MGTESKHIDELAASYLEWLGGDESLARELALAMLPEISAHLERISEAIAASDAAGLQAAAHRLKGAFGVFGEHPAFELAQRLETCGRCGRVDEALSLWKAFESATEEFSMAAMVLAGRLSSGH